MGVAELARPETRTLPRRADVAMILVLSWLLPAAAELGMAVPTVPPPPVVPPPPLPQRALPDVPGIPMPALPSMPSMPSLFTGNPSPPGTMTDALASDAITTRPPAAIGFDLKGFHMTAEEIRESELKLKQEEENEEKVEREEIGDRHAAYKWLKAHNGDMEASVCKAAGTMFNFRVLTQLLKMGGSVNKQMCGPDSATPLHLVSYWGIAEGVKSIMRELGGDPNLCNAKGLPPVYGACGQIGFSSNKETIDALVAGGADLNMEVEGVPLVKLAMQKGDFKIARCLLDAGATWPFLFDSKLSLFGKDYALPDTPLGNEGSHFHLCEAARTGNATAVVSYLASGMDMDYGLCWSPGLRWMTSIIGHAAYYGQKEVVTLLKKSGAFLETSKMCEEKHKQCHGSACFSCYSPCKAYQCKEEPLQAFKKVMDPEIESLLNC